VRLAKAKLEAPGAVKEDLATLPEEIVAESKEVSVAEDHAATEQSVVTAEEEGVVTTIPAPQGTNNEFLKSKVGKGLSAIKQKALLARQKRSAEAELAAAAAEEAKIAGTEAEDLALKLGPSRDALRLRLARSAVSWHFVLWSLKPGFLLS